MTLADLARDILDYLDSHPDDPPLVRQRMVMHMIQAGVGEVLGAIASRALVDYPER